MISCLIALPSIWVYAIIEQPAYSKGKACLPQNHITHMALTNVLITTNGAWLYPIFILAILTIILSRKLWKISKERNNLSNINAQNERANRKEIQSAIITAVLGAVQCALFIPNGVTWAIYYSVGPLKLLNINIPPDLASLIIAIARSILCLTIICHFYNLFLYLYRIPSFRHDFLDLVRCCSRCQIRDRTSTSSRGHSLGEGRMESTRSGEVEVLN